MKSIRWLIQLGMLGSIFFTVSAEDPASLYVFVPTEVRANAMQEDIGNVCPNINITVFGRSKDFRQQITESPPDAILTLLPVIERSADYKTILKGARGDATEEDYVIVSVDTPLNIADLNEKRLGVIDLLGRKPMNEFIDQLLQTTVKTKRVTKVEDLLPLLTFKAVDGLFISDSLYQSLKEKSNLNLVATSLNIKVGLVSAALNTEDSKEKIVSCIEEFSHSLNSVLGVEQWRGL